MTQSLGKAVWQLPHEVDHPLAYHLAVVLQVPAKGKRGSLATRGPARECRRQLYSQESKTKIQPGAHQRRTSRLCDTHDGILPGFKNTWRTKNTEEFRKPMSSAVSSTQNNTNGITASTRSLGRDGRPPSPPSRSAGLG